MEVTFGDGHNKTINNSNFKMNFEYPADLSRTLQKASYIGKLLSFHYHVC